MCSSAFRGSDLPGPDGGEGRGQTCTKTFLGHVGMNVQKFIHIGLDFHQPSTYQLVMGAGQKFLTRVGSGCLSHLWFGFEF